MTIRNRMHPQKQKPNVGNVWDGSADTHRSSFVMVYTSQSHYSEGYSRNDGIQAIDVVPGWNWVSWPSNGLWYSFHASLDTAGIDAVVTRHAVSRRYENGWHGTLIDFDMMYAGDPCAVHANSTAQWS